jgi:hypothetical protein
MLELGGGRNSGGEGGGGVFICLQPAGTGLIESEKHI